jgi:hypothetical protein
MIRWSLLTIQHRTDTQVLIDFANETLSEETAQAANAIAEQMTREDVRATMWWIEDIVGSFGNPQEDRHSSEGLQNAVNCAEEVAFTSMDVSAAYLEASPYPQLQSWSLEENEALFVLCDYYPGNLDESVTEPVVSDIPTLIYNSSLDTQTVFSWGLHVAESLSNSYMVVWENSGHIGLSHDTGICSGSILAAFLDNPDREPDSSCSQSEMYKLDWILPE